MRKVILSLLVVLLALPSAAFAGITGAFDTTGLINKIKFTNYESFIVESPDGGYLVVDPEKIGEYGSVQLLSIFSATELTIQDPSNPGVFGPAPAWQKGSDYFLGYSVVDVSGSAGGPLTYSNPTFDPFGHLNLAAGEALILKESSTDWKVTGVIGTDVASIFADPTPAWGTFGFQTATNGGGFTPLPPAFGTLIGVSWFGLDAVSGPGAPFFDKDKAFGNDIFGGANIYVPGEGQWSARSEDPLTFAAVPEPATVALWGGFLAIGAVLALRRRQK